MTALDPPLIECIHGEIDGTNTPEESRALQRVLEESAEARAFYHDMLELGGQIPRLKMQIPPAGLPEAVEAAIQSVGHASPKEEAPLKTNVVAMSSSSPSFGKIAASISILVVAVAAVIYFSAGLDQPDPSQVAGTASSDTNGIQKANRFRQSQITDTDVFLENEQFQKVLQSDEFIKLMESGALTELSKFYFAAFNNPQTAELMASAQFAQAVSQPDFLQMMASPEMQQLMLSSNFAAALNNPQFQQLMQNETFQQLAANADVTDLAANEDFKQLMAAAAFQELAASSYFQNLMSDAQFLKMMQMPYAARFYNSPQTAELLSSAQFVAAFNNPAMQELLSSAQFTAAFNNPQFQQLMNNPDFLAMMSSPAFHELLQQESFLNAF